MFKNKKLFNIKLKQLQEKNKRVDKENVIKFNSHSTLIHFLKKKYPTFFNIIDNTGIQYKQFLSGFFKCILKNKNEPFLIKISKKNVCYCDKDYKLFLYNKYTSNNNYLSLLPWDKYNVLYCDKVSKHELKDKYDLITFGETPTEEIRLNKEQFMECLIVLFPKFIKMFPKELLDLNNKLNNIPKSTISIKHLYNYLIYCGDKLAKINYEKYKLKNDEYLKFTKLSNEKIYNFLRVFSYEQLIKILVN